MRVDSFLNESLKKQYLSEYEGSHLNRPKTHADYIGSWLYFLLSKALEQPPKEEKAIKEGEAALVLFLKGWIEESNAHEDDPLSFWTIFPQHVKYTDAFISPLLKENLPFVSVYHSIFYTLRSLEREADGISELATEYTFFNMFFNMLAFTICVYLFYGLSILLPVFISSVAVVQLLIILLAVRSYFENVIEPWNTAKKGVNEEIELIEETPEVEKIGKENLNILMQKGRPGYCFAFWSELFRFKSTNQKETTQEEESNIVMDDTAYQL